MNRRDFLKVMLAACAAPAIVKAENIMRINPDIITPEFRGGVDLGDFIWQINPKDTPFITVSSGQDVADLWEARRKFVDDVLSGAIDVKHMRQGRGIIIGQGRGTITGHLKS